MLRILLSLAAVHGIAWGIQSAHAGQEVGNGGNVVICPGQRPGVEILDLVEARQLTRAAFKSRITAKDAAERVRFLLGELSKVDPVFARRLGDSFHGIPGDFRFLKRADLTPIPDSLHLAIPRGCQLKQVAIRVADPQPGAPRYVVDQILWYRMDVRSQAALILHELIYNDQIADGATDSREARALNALLQSGARGKGQG